MQRIFCKARSRLRLFSTRASRGGIDAFKAPENFVGSVGTHQQHVVVASGHHKWPKSIIDDPFVARVVGSVSRVPDVKFTCSDNSIGEATNDEKRDVFLYPDMIRFKGVTADDAKAVADVVKASRTNPAVATLMSPLDTETTKDQVHILVCTHGEVDQRCGKCGQEVFLKILSEIDRRGLNGKVKVQRSSHVGGHAFAANAIVYPMSDWYGMLNENDVSLLLDAIESKTVYWPKWRGRSGITKEDQLRLFTESGSSSKGSSASTKTVKITIVLENGEEKEYDVPLGKRLLDLCKENNIPSIEGVCDGHLECATCHIYVDPMYADKIPKPSEAELDMLEYALFRNDSSRLTCQLRADEAMEGMRLSVPKA
ncbi:hypothetical protein HDU67_009874 [Dinochytrium kinnereticum]|nr:hypothetical protein HDU67_009874 [Dinochytrium kinnereticum]